MPHRIEPRATAHLTNRARQLRREAPIPERILWSLLRNRALGGLKFRRQQPIGPYFVDYYSESARLIVELDGRSHDETEAADAVRDKYLRERGLRVLRIQNDDLMKDRLSVAEVILTVAEETPSPHPSPSGRGGPPSPHPSPSGRGGPPSRQPSRRRTGRES